MTVTSFTKYISKTKIKLSKSKIFEFLKTLGPSLTQASQTAKTTLFLSDSFLQTEKTPRIEQLRHLSQAKKTKMQKMQKNLQKAKTRGLCHFSQAKKSKMPKAQRIQQYHLWLAKVMTQKVQSILQLNQTKSLKIQRM